jgi:Effector Associated Constant Component 1
MGSTSAARAAFDVVLEPRSDDYGPDDDRWRDQVSTLRGELRDRVEVRDQGRSVPGTKGTIDELIVSLGSAGAFTAMVECVRAWLARDRNRRIDVRWDENGTERFVSFSGDAVDRETVRTIARAAANRVGGEGWSAGTEPS